jgi:hypothetical protein
MGRPASTPPAPARRPSHWWTTPLPGSGRGPLSRLDAVRRGLPAGQGKPSAASRLRDQHRSVDRNYDLAQGRTCNTRWNKQACDHGRPRPAEHRSTPLGARRRQACGARADRLTAQAADVDVTSSRTDQWLAWRGSSLSRRSHTRTRAALAVRSSEGDGNGLGVQAVAKVAAVTDPGGWGLDACWVPLRAGVVAFAAVGQVAHPLVSAEVCGRPARMLCAARLLGRLTISSPRRRDRRWRASARRG